MALGIVSLALNMSDKEFKSSMDRAVGQVKNSINTMKDIMIAAALGSYLMTGAEDAINAAVDQMHAKLNLMNEGLSEVQYSQIAAMAEQFELLGGNAETAQLKITEFIVQGKSRGLTELGIYLDADTQSMLAQLDAGERLQWMYSNFPKYLQGMSDMLPDNIENMIQMRKTFDDLKEAMGTTFLGVIQKITEAFGGIIPAMKTAIVAFTAYKTAMILGNIGIGISKAIAVGTVFSAGAAIAMGASALLAIGGLIGGASLAVSALNDVEANQQTSTSDYTSGNDNKEEKETIVVIRDKFGDTQQTLTSASGGGSSSVQTNFGK